MIRLATLEDLHRQQHTLGLYCLCCERWSEADLDGLVARGLGRRSVEMSRFRCRDCGSLAQKQVRPPVPGGAAARAWI